MIYNNTGEKSGKIHPEASLWELPVRLTAIFPSLQLGSWRLVTYKKTIAGRHRAGIKLILQAKQSKNDILGHEITKLKSVLRRHKYDDK